MTRRPPVALLAVALGLAVVGAAAARPLPGAAAMPPPPAPRPQQGVVLVCPEVPPQGQDLVTTTTVATALPGPGTAVVAPLAAAPAPAAPAPAPVTLDLAAPLPPLPPPTGPLVVTATGPAAAGLVAQRVTRGAAGRDRGYSVDRCTEPRTDGWFVGASTAAGAGAALHVVNPEDTPAEVTVRALTRDGPVSPPGARGTRIEPHVTYDLPLELLAPMEPALAVEVVAARGRVASSIREYRGLGAAAPGGVDAVPQADAATRVVTVPGVPGNPAGTVLEGDRLHAVLTVGVPGPADATVRVEVLDAARRFTPLGLDAVPVPAGTVRQLDLDPALPGGPAAVRVTSAEGVGLVAGVLVLASAGQGDASEALQLGATPPLAGPAVVPDVRTGPGLATVLTAAAAGGPTTLTVTGGGPPAVVAIPAGRAAALPVPPGPGPVLIAPPPRGAEVYVAAVVVERGPDGPLLGGAGLRGRPAAVAVPAARSDPALPLVSRRR